MKIFLDTGDVEAIKHIIEATEVAFDDFAGGKSDGELNKKILGL